MHDVGGHSELSVDHSVELVGLNLYYSNEQSTGLDAPTFLGKLCEALPK